MSGRRQRRRRNRAPVPVAEPVTISGVAEGGRGIARVDGKAVFVAGALLGERLSIAITRRHERYDEAEVVDVIDASPDRQQPPCDYFDQCGGCSLQHQRAPAQIRDKQTILLEQLQRIGEVTPDDVAEPLSASAWNYRSKARLGVRYVHAKQRVLVGFREKKQRGVVDMSVCPVLDPRVSAALQPLSETIAALTVRERIPQIEVATDADTVVFIVRHLDPLQMEDRTLLREFADSSGIRLMLQPGGVDTIHPLPPDNADPLAYELAAHSVRVEFLPQQFTQVNLVMNEKMVDQALRWLQPQPDDRVADLFCGVGNFSLPLARRCQHLVGIEGSSELVVQANRNAQINGISNTEFICGDLFEQPDGLPADFDRLLIDPPRSGAQQVCSFIERFGRRGKPPAQLLYVSCNPATLARDSGLLVAEKGYRLCRVGVMDMFPHTSHVESMALFEQVN